MHAIVHAADIQDRDGGVLLMATLFGLYPFLLKLYADGGYQGAKFQDALRAILKRVNIEIVKRSDQAQRFIVLPKRWIVERTFGWLVRNRRLVHGRPPQGRAVHRRPGHGPAAPWPAPARPDRRDQQGHLRSRRCARQRLGPGSVAFLGLHFSSVVALN